jgi:hypothetical protein
MSKIFIEPKKPVYQKGFFEYMIWLNEKQIDYGNLKSRKELKGFKEQTDRHITIIGDIASIKIEKALSKLSISKRKKKINEIKFLLKSFKWQFYQKDIYRIEKKKYFGNTKILEHRKSYIIVIEMPDIKIFYRKLNILLKTRIPTQIPHITLFTKGECSLRGYFGISVPSKSAFRKLNPKKIK